MATAVQTAPLSMAKSNFFSSPGKRTVVLSLLLGLLTLITYNGAARNGFVSFDDPAYITSNRQVQAGLHWETIKWAFRSTENANWHPLTWLSHALDCQLFHGNPAGHHYTSVLLHALCTVLLFVLFEAATRATWRSAVTAALFAAHPLNVESVAWISERKSVLCMLFFCLALLAYRSYTSNPNLKRYSLVALFFAMALMSKPMAITLPFVLLLLDYWPLEREKNTTWLRLVYEKLPLFALSAASAVVTLLAQHAGGAIHGKYSLLDRLLNAIISYALYLKKAVWPSRLAAFYPHPEHTAPLFNVIASLAVLALITAAVVKFKNRRYLAVGWFWFLGTLVPMIGLVQVGEQAMADRYAYLPFIGLFVAAVWGIADWAGSHSKTVYAGSLAGLAMLSFLIVTRVQIGYWKNSAVLWSHALDVTERNAMAHDSVGAELINEGKIPQAMPHFREALAIDPTDAFSHLDLGVCQKRLGNIEVAVQEYQTALRISTEPSLKATALGNLGSIYRASGDYNKARESYQGALELLPTNKFALIGLGLVAQRTAHLPQAVEYYSRAVSAEPSDVTYFLLAQALEKAGRRDEAQAAYAQAQHASTNWDATVQSANHLLRE